MPPPKGMAVLFGTGDDPSRVCFESLRFEEWWASERQADWSDCLMYAYCSVVDRDHGVPGDFAITLYTGTNKRLRAHIKSCIDATHEVLNSLVSSSGSLEVFLGSQRIFQDCHLKNCVVSITDEVSLDLGHSYPVVDVSSVPADEFQLPVELCGSIRSGRKFLNGTSDWDLAEPAYFTIEPQLIDVRDKTLPQISQHYIVRRHDVNTKVDLDLDVLFRRFDLL